MWIYESDYEIVSKLNEEEWKVLNNLCQQEDNNIVRCDYLIQIYIYYNGCCAHDTLTPTRTPTLYEYLLQMEKYNNSYFKKQCKNWKKFKNKELFPVKDVTQQDYSQIEKFIKRIGV